jgi:hypothetical protein
VHLRKIEPTNTPTPATIAAGVRKTPELIAAQETLRQLRADREALMAAVHELNSHRGDRDADARLLDLHKTREALEERIVAARRCRNELLKVYTADVAKRVAPLTRETGSRILAATAELEAALATVAELTDLGTLRDAAVPTVGLAKIRDLGHRLSST